MTNIRKIFDYLTTLELIDDREKEHFKYIGKNLFGSYICLAGIGLGVLITLGIQSIAQSSLEKRIEKREETKVYVEYMVDTAPHVQSKLHSKLVTLEELEALRKDKYIFNLKIN